MASEHPEWKTQQPYQAVLEGDMKALAASGEKGLIEAKINGWTVVDMKKEWKVVYP